MFPEHSETSTIDYITLNKLNELNTINVTGGMFVDKRTSPKFWKRSLRPLPGAELEVNQEHDRWAKVIKCLIKCLKYFGGLCADKLIWIEG